jgi:AraC-like DNA-binding protein
VLLFGRSAAPGHSQALHAHPEGQLYVVTNGLVVVEAAGASWIMPRGRVGWIPPGVLHGASLHGSSAPAVITAYTIYLSAELCKGLPSAPAVLRITGLLQAILERMTSWDGVVEPLSQRDVHLLHVFLDELRAAQEEPLRLPMPRERRLVMMADAIAHDPADEGTIASWAARVGLSPRTLTRHFRAETGISFVQWRNLARLKRSLEMLAEGQSVTATAISLGYDNVSSFITLFRRTFGTTPSRYVVR